MVVKRRHGLRSGVSPQQFKTYLNCYKCQSGGGIAKFQGVPQQYGYGLGGILRAIIRKIIPIGAKVIKAIKPVAKSAYKIAKPHLKAAAQDLTKEAVGHVAKKLANLNNTDQSGSGRKRKSANQRQGGGKSGKVTKPKPKNPGQKRVTQKKKRSAAKKKPASNGKRTNRPRSCSPGYIF